METLEDKRELSLSLLFIGFMSSAWFAQKMLFPSYTIFFSKLYFFIPSDQCDDTQNDSSRKILWNWENCVTKLNEEEFKYWAVNTELAWLFPVAVFSWLFHGWAQIATVFSLVPLHGPVHSGIHNPRAIINLYISLTTTKPSSWGVPDKRLLCWIGTNSYIHFGEQNLKNTCQFELWLNLLKVQLRIFS